MKFVLLTFVAIVSFMMGFWLWNPMVRNQPDKYACLTAERINSLSFAILRFCDAKKRMPYSLDELVDSGFAGKADCLDAWHNEFIFERVDDCCVRILSYCFDTPFIRAYGKPDNEVMSTISKTIRKGVENAQVQ
jgi:hypothetical protein